jgi:hypothetical protein
MISGIMVAMAAMASIPVTTNPKVEVCRCKTDTLIHSTSATKQMQGELDEYQSIVMWCRPGMSAIVSYISRVGIVPMLERFIEALGAPHTVSSVSLSTVNLLRSKLAGLLLQACPTYHIAQNLQIQHLFMKRETKGKLCCSRTHQSSELNFNAER